jgi:hypothetical protein
MSLISDMELLRCWDYDNPSLALDAAGPSTPTEVMQHASDPNEHLIQILRGAVGGGAAVWRTRRRTLARVTDALVGHHHAALGQDQLDIIHAKAEHVIQPQRMPDDLRREAMTVIRTGLWRQPRLTWQCPMPAYVNGWKMSPSCYVNQDLATVWVAK